MRDTRVALLPLGVLALLLTRCYWLTNDDDLSRDFGSAAPGDAGGGAPTDGAQPFCPADAGPLAYCMSFDGVDASALELTLSGAAAAIVNGPFVSPPGALFVGLEGAASFARYQVPFAVQPTTVALQFDMLPVGLNAGVTTMAITLSQASTQTTRSLNVVVAPNAGFQVQEYIALPDGGSEVAPHPWSQVDGGVLPTWHHVVLTLTADDANQRYTSGLRVDGQNLEQAVPLTLPWARGDVRLDIGVTYAASGGSEFYFDDVRADFGL